MTENAQPTKVSTKDDQSYRLAKFDEIFVEHPGSVAVAEGVHLLIEDTERAIAHSEMQKEEAGGREIYAEELWILPIVGPSGSTKSHSLRHYIGSRPAGDRSIVVARLRSTTRTPKDLQIQILEAMGDEAAVSAARRSRDSADITRTMGKVAREHGTVVVALDDAQHMIANDGMRASNMATVLNGLVKHGLFSLVLLGTGQMTGIWRQSAELSSRMKRPVLLGPPNGETNLNHDEFFSFVDMFERNMLDSRVLNRRLGVAEDAATREAMYRAAHGLVGNVPRILRLALERALSNPEAAYSYLTLDDVHAAIFGELRQDAEETTLVPIVSDVLIELDRDSQDRNGKLPSKTDVWTPAPRHILIAPPPSEAATAQELLDGGLQRKHARRRGSDTRGINERTRSIPARADARRRPSPERTVHPPTLGA